MKDYAPQNELERPAKKHGWVWIGVWFAVSLLFWYTLAGALV